MTITAKILCDSVNEYGNRLTTFELTYPRIIHSEVLTHRMFSRNSASSRAIPVSKMINNIKDNPFIPEFWGKNQPGMQAFEEIDMDKQELAKNLILDHLESCITLVLKLNELGLHKQICNRYLEPFMNITVILSTTNIKHFKSLRLDMAAEPHFQRLAKAMLDAYDNSIPQQLKTGEWHLPLVGFSGDENLSLEDKIKVSAGRCARVSYLTHDGKRDIQKDIELGDTLAKNGHFSPLEHQAMATEPKRIGNFFGWKQYRKFFENEYVMENLECTL